MIAGIDEAGKGCVIGPLVVVGVACDCEDCLKRIKVRDSKKLTKKRREELAEKIIKIAKIEIVKINAEELDKLMEAKTLNEILKETYEYIIKKLKPSIVFLDSPDVKPERLANYLKSATGVKVVAEHKADEKYPIVSSASIIAKVERDKEIERLKEEFGDFGSGYASDPKTIAYLKGQKEIPSFVRKKWKTLRKMTQKELHNFFRTP
ncbi:MAG: ribonuclease HII [Archaeoglobaceae archaeon]|nr:ribonuclease HII [Archaeoglobaceae archaeon]MDW7989435.1 ribonuclease HII [Archaeoglobaceae archaeon]